MANRSPRSALWAALCAVALLAACGGKSKTGTTDGITGGEVDTMVPKVDDALCDVKGKRIETADLTGDNRPNVWKMYQTIEEGGTSLEVLTCKQVDINNDGRKDMVVAYNAKGSVLYEKFDFDWDGYFDAVVVYDEKTGKVVEIQRTTGFEERYDLKEVYDTEGNLISVRRDRNGDGLPDLWEQYEDGVLVAILYDDNFDGRVDRREEVPRPKPAQTMPTALDDPDDLDDGLVDDE
jgi:hypothetical protein